MKHFHHFSHKSERNFSIYWILAIVVAALVLTLVVLIPLVQAQEGGRAEREPKEAWNIISGNGIISGTITSEANGSPISYMSVLAYSFNGLEWEQIAHVLTDQKGQYQFTDLNSGNYRLLFHGTYVNHIDEYYENASNITNAKDIFVNNDVVVIDAALSQLGSITGTVTDKSDGSPINVVDVIVYRLVESGWINVETEETRTDGVYTITGLFPGTYRLKYHTYRRYIDEYYDDASTLDDATDIAVTTNQTTTHIDAQLIKLSQINGTVTGEDNGLPIDPVIISAYRFVDGEWDFYKNGHANASGQYIIDGLPIGTYRLNFFCCYHSPSTYKSEYYENAPDLESAADINITENNSTTVIDAELSAYGRITGTVRADIDGRPLEYIYVGAKLIGSDPFEGYYSDSTDSKGQFEINGLPPGSYKIRYFHESIVEEYYDDSPDAEGAIELQVSLNKIMPNIDASLTVYGMITGTITAEDSGAPISTVEAHVYRFNGSDWEHTGKYQATNLAGDYAVAGLQAGTYRVFFNDLLENYLFEYYDNASSLESATDISVSLNSVTSGIDAMLAHPNQVDNDSFDNPRIISDFPYVSTQNVQFATWASDDPGIPCYYNNQGRGSVWYSITPKEEIMISVDTFGSDYATNLAIWRGNRGNLINIACDNNSSGSQSIIKEVILEANKTYFIEVVALYHPENLVLNVILKNPTRFGGCIAKTDNFNTVVLPADIRLSDELSFEAGDEIALFTTGESFCAGFGVWNGENLNIKVWGDDSQTEGKDGFFPEEEMSFHWYDKSEVFFHQRIEPTYESGDGLYKPNSVHVISTLDIKMPPSQKIELLQGWNMISSYLGPEPPAMSEIFAPPLEDDLGFCKNGYGQVYWPSMSSDQIGKWNPFHGYQCYMNNAATLKLRGIMIPTGTKWELEQGWNLIGYWVNQSLAVETAIAACREEIFLAKNGAGQIYWPEFGLNQIGEMQPGQGYQLYLTEPCTFSYPQN